MTKELYFNLSYSETENYLKTTESTADNGIHFEYIITFLWINYGFLCLVIGLFGISTNVINIICFVKEGLSKESVNVSLFGLAVSDICCLITLIWTSICCTPGFSTIDLPFHPVELQYLTSAWPHVTFTRVSSAITAFITIERCLCITNPLKVKNIATPRRAAVAVICIYITLISSVAPVYVVNRLGNVYFPERNKTIIGLIYAENRELLEAVSYAINNIFVHVTSFVIIIICTMILVVKLQSSTKWREKTLGTVQAENILNRNQKVCKMVVVISTLFIACVLPVTIMYLVVLLDPKISPNGEYRQILVLLFGMSFLMESINSSANIFIYYNMSSKYKSTFHHVLCTQAGKG